MTLGERIKKVRQSKDLTQQKFAEQIGVKQNTIALIESGKRNTSDQLLLSICREFNVSEEWLRTGIGKPSAPKSEEEELKEAIDSMLKGRNPNFKRRLISVLASLDEDDWLVLEEKVLELAEAAKPESVPMLAALPVRTGQEADHEAEVRSEAELFYQQRLLEKQRESQAQSAKESGLA